MRKEKILLIEDQADFQTSVMLVLGRDYEISVAPSITEAVSLLDRETFRLVLLDVGLPDEDGFSFLERMRDSVRDRHIPVVFLTARDEIEDRIKGFGIGAIDYIVKPFEPREFKARVDAHVKRIIEREGIVGVVQRGRLTLDPVQKTCLRCLPDGSSQKLELTNSEFELLYFLSNHQGTVVSRDRLLSSVWGDVNVLSRTVDRHISTLRKKLEPPLEVLEAVHGQGYRLILRKMI